MYSTFENRIMAFVIAIFAVSEIDQVLQNVQSFASIPEAVIFSNSFLIVMHDFIVILYLIAASILLTVSKPAKDVYHAFLPNFVAFIAAASSLLMLAIPRAEAPLVIPIVGTSLAIVGAIVTALALAELTTSFSITPQVRSMRTKGIYSFVRHPMYLGGIVSVAAVALARGTYLHLLILALVIMLQLIRISYEERLLKKNYPEDFKKYSDNVGMIIPKFKPTGSVSLIVLSMMIFGNSTTLAKEENSTAIDNASASELVAQTCADLSNRIDEGLLNRPLFSLSFDLQSEAESALSTVISNEETARSLPACEIVLESCAFIELKVRAGIELTDDQKSEFSNCVLASSRQRQLGGIRPVL